MRDARVPVPLRLTVSPASTFVICSKLALSLSVASYSRPPRLARCTSSALMVAARLTVGVDRM
ncbi:hypothetical protein D3C72_1579910 [compost metagenome]